MKSRFSNTSAVQAGIDQDPTYGAVMPPLYLSTNYSFAAIGEKRAYDYSRTANPTRDLLAATLAELEGGAGASVTATGMAAVTLVASLLDAGDRVIVPHNCYGGTHRLFTALNRTGRLEAQFLDFSEPGALAAACRKKAPKLIWVETPSNPLLRVTDIQAVSHLAREHGALLAVDNTFLSPLLQKPLALGADIVVHSTTKFINGHSDMVGGAVIAADESMAEALGWWANCLGLTASAFDCYLTQRGLRTLGARLRCHEEATVAVLEVLTGHQAVAGVHYPGLASHPDHELASRQQSGFGSILSFELAGGEPALQAFVGALKHFTLAESLGGVESLVCHPATMTHGAMSEEDREIAGIGAGLLRLSVGIEAPQDLAGDLARALDAAQAATDAGAAG